MITQLKKIAFILLLYLTALSCERETEWRLQESEIFLVVDVIITNEIRQHLIKAYNSSQKLNQQPAPVSNIEFKLYDGNNTITFSEDISNPGYYYSDTSFSATVGIKYMLTLANGNNHDTAYAEMASVLTSINDAIEKTGELYKYVYRGSSRPAMTEVLYDWSANPNYCESYGACSAREVFYTIDGLNISKEFAPEKQTILFPVETSVIRRKYSLNKEHQNFIRSLLLETEWRGGIFN